MSKLLAMSLHFIITYHNSINFLIKNSASVSDLNLLPFFLLPM